MNKKKGFLLAGAFLLAIGFTFPPINAVPSVYPTGTTIYKPDQAWNGYTIIDAADGNGAVLLDMNGNVLRRWPQLAGIGPFRILPGGYVMGGDVRRNPYQESIALRQFDWEDNEVWHYDHAEQVITEETENEDGETEGGEMVWAARQHHDWQRQGNPIGYYAPDMEPSATEGKTLILSHKNVTVPEITE